VAVAGHFLLAATEHSEVATYSQRVLDPESFAPLPVGQAAERPVVAEHDDHGPKEVPPRDYPPVSSSTK
jgi:hypothetical protein